MMWIVLIIAALTLIGVVAWMWERAYYANQPFTFSQLVFLLLLIPVFALIFVFFANPSKKAQTDPSQPLVGDFPDKGVLVIVPWQGRPVAVIAAPSLPLDRMKSDRDEFTPDELVINVEVVDGHDQHIVLTDFDPSVEMQFKLSPRQIEAARKLAVDQKKPAETPEDLAAVIKVGFWDGARWVLFTREKHGFQIVGSQDSLVAKVRLKKWGDPPIAWTPSR
jgi:hypothetical protein